MKKIISCALVILVLVMMSSSALAYYTNTYTPSPKRDLNDLSHSNYFWWVIQDTNLSSALSNGETIKSATLTFSQIWDWKYGEVDTLFINLANDKANGGSQMFSWKNGQKVWGDTWSYADNNPAPNNSLGAGTEIYAWNDPNGGSIKYATDLTFDLVNDGYAGLLALLAGDDGKFAFGFDPDCHYYNNGITLKIETDKPNQVPEPGSLLLFGSGLIGLAFFSRQKKG